MSNKKPSVVLTTVVVILLAAIFALGMWWQYLQFRATWIINFGE